MRVSKSFRCAPDIEKSLVSDKFLKESTHFVYNMTLFPHVT